MFSDPLSGVLRSGVRALLTQAVEAEEAAFLDSHADERTEDGRRRLVRHADGVRESTRSWRELLLDLKRRGLMTGKVAVVMAVAVAVQA